MFPSKPVCTISYPQNILTPDQPLTFFSLDLEYLQLSNTVNNHLPPVYRCSDYGSTTTSTMTLKTLIYYLSEHPNIINFRWSHTQSWGSTWSFLFTSILTYILLSLLLHLFLLPRRRPVPLGPIPALHSLFMALISLTIFTGILFSAAAEIRDTRWFWRRTNTTPFQWFLCFPLGTRPSGRVFFWSYIFYLTRFLHTFRTFFAILSRRKLSFFRLFNHSILILMSFLWLEFSQSFQIIGILLTTSIYSIVYGYRFWTAIGLRSACFPFVINCQMVLLACNVICHVGVLMLHVKKGGCNGIGAWGINSVLNVAILLLFINFYVNSHLRGRRNITALTSDHRDDVGKVNVAPGTVESDCTGCKLNDKDI